MICAVPRKALPRNEVEAAGAMYCLRSCSRVHDCYRNAKREGLCLRASAVSFPKRQNKKRVFVFPKNRTEQNMRYVPCVYVCVCVSITLSLSLSLSLPHNHTHNLSHTQRKVEGIR